MFILQLRGGRHDSTAAPRTKPTRPIESNRVCLRVGRLANAAAAADEARYLPPADATEWPARERERERRYDTRLNKQTNRANGSLRLPNCAGALHAAPLGLPGRPQPKRAPSAYGERAHRRQEQRKYHSTLRRDLALRRRLPLGANRPIDQVQRRADSSRATREPSAGRRRPCHPTRPPHGKQVNYANGFWHSCGAANLAPRAQVTGRF